MFIYNFEKKGFTLLEVLIVVTIVGLLVSVVIFSLRESKLKSADGAIKSSLDQANDQAELYYNFNFRSYEGVCQDDPSDPNTIGRFLVAAQRTWGGPVNSPYDNGGNSSFVNNTETCNDDTDGYAAWVPLQWQSGTAWCIDSSNFQGAVDQPLAGGITKCPPGI